MSAIEAIDKIKKAGITVPHGSEKLIAGMSISRSSILKLNIIFKGGLRKKYANSLSYITLLQANGADLGLMNDEVITKQAIEDSMVERKDLGIWDLETWGHFSVWGVAAANAICMKTLQSGEYVNSFVHNNGYSYASAGQEGYFNTFMRPTDAGMTSGSSHAAIIKLTDQPQSGTFFGSYFDSSSGYYLYQGGGSDPYFWSAQMNDFDGFDDIESSANPGLLDAGIISLGKDGDRAFLTRRTENEFVTVIDRNYTPVGSFPDMDLYVHAINYGANAGDFNSFALGGAFLAKGLTFEKSSALSENLKKLFKSVTSLSLLPV